MTGEQLKEEGTSLVLANNEQWKEAVLQQLCAVAMHGDEFTANDLRCACALAGISDPAHCNAWGAVFAKASRERLIQHVRFQRSDNPRSHSRVLAVWRKA